MNSPNLGCAVSKNGPRKMEMSLRVWLFGSRARGDAREDSDVDLALTFMPPKGNYNWALGNYASLGKNWQAELEKVVGRHVSLELMPFELLWRRDAKE